MRCPFCAAPNTRVSETRLAGSGDQVRRRRECPTCGERFTTFEKVELTPPRVIKSGGSREPFDEAKLRGGMLRALEKRPVPADAVETALSAVVRRACGSGEREIPSRRLGEWIMETLRGLDQVAYVRFASVYRNFQDVSAFRDEIERLEREPAGDRQLPLLPDPTPAGTRTGRRRTRRAKPTP